MRRVFAYIFAFLFFASPAVAATYCMDATAGNDGSDGLCTCTGTSCTGNAWQTLTKLNAMTFSAGDYIRLKCGETWRGKWAVLGNGVAGNPITITKYGSCTGSNDPIIDAASANAQVFNIGVKNYWTIDGIHVKNATSANIVSNVSTGTVVTNVTSTGGNYGVYATGGSTVEISNTTITGAASGLIFLNVAGANILSNTTITGVTTGNAVNIDGSAVTASDITIQNATGATSIGFKVYGASTVSLTNFNIDTCGTTGIYQTASAALTLSSGTVQNCGEDGVSANGTGSVTATNVRCTANGSNGGAADGDGFTAHDTSTLNLNYCIADKNQKAGLAVVGSSTGTIKNCSFYDNYDATVTDDYGIIINTTGATSWTVRNTITKNHRYEIYIAAGAVAAGLTLDSDYNCFDDSRGGTAFHYNGTDYNFADYQTNSSQDANSINDDPLFESADSAVFRLTAESPCIDAGTDVSLTTDFDGVAVPYSSAPDIGAFEHHDSFVYGKGRLKTCTGCSTVTTP